MTRSLCSSRKWVACCLCVLALLVSACAPTPSEGTATPTPTPTAGAVANPTRTPTVVAGDMGSGSGETPVAEPTDTPDPSATPSPTPSPCEGVSGGIEVRVLVGPAAAVGLETHAVGTVPFTVGTAQSIYAVSGGGHISFSDVLSEDEIHYDVSFEADVVFDGTCDMGPGGAQLLLGVGMVWDQIVHVTAEDFDETYSQAGENEKDVTLPLIDGASADVDEGMEIVLRLDR